VALSRFCWIASSLAGAVAAGYLFLIREPHLDAVAERVRGVDGTRADETYRTVADLMSWTLFGVLVAILLVHITTQVSYAGRRPGTRWWMLGLLLTLAGVLVAARELVAFGDRGTPLALMIAVQAGFLALGLLVSVLPPALRWTARGHDVAPHAAAESVSRD
jgi:hypothetical protein